MAIDLATTCQAADKVSDSLRQQVREIQAVCSGCPVHFVALMTQWELSGLVGVSKLPSWHEMLGFQLFGHFFMFDCCRLPMNEHAKERLTSLKRPTRR